MLFYYFRNVVVEMDCVRSSFLKHRVLYSPEKQLLHRDFVTATLNIVQLIEFPVHTMRHIHYAKIQIQDIKPNFCLRAICSDVVSMVYGAL